MLLVPLIETSTSKNNKFCKQEPLGVGKSFWPAMRFAATPAKKGRNIDKWTITRPSNTYQIGTVEFAAQHLRIVLGVSRQGPWTEGRATHQHDACKQACMGERGKQKWVHSITSSVRNSMNVRHRTSSRGKMEKALFWCWMCSWVYCVGHNQNRRPFFLDHVPTHIHRGRVLHPERWHRLRAEGDGRRHWVVPLREVSTTRHNWSTWEESRADANGEQETSGITAPVHHDGKIPEHCSAPAATIHGSKKCHQPRTRPTSIEQLIDWLALIKKQATDRLDNWLIPSPINGWISSSLVSCVISTFSLPFVFTCFPRTVCPSQ